MKELNGYLVNYTDNFNHKHITYLKTLSEIKALQLYLSPEQVHYEPTHLSSTQLNPQKEAFLEIQKKF